MPKWLSILINTNYQYGNYIRIKQKRGDTNVLTFYDKTFERGYYDFLSVSAENPSSYMSIGTKGEYVYQIYLDSKNLLTGLLVTLNNSRTLSYKEGNVNMTYSLDLGLFRIILSSSNNCYFSPYENYILNMTFSYA